MITRVVRSAFARLVKPSFRGIQNPEHLLMNKQNVLHTVESLNRYISDPTMTPLRELSAKLSVPASEFNSFSAKFLEVPVYENSGSVHRISFSVGDGTLATPLHNLKLEKPSLEVDITRHPSLDKQISTRLKEHTLKEDQILLFNLPADFQKGSQGKLLKNLKVENVEIGFCLLGLPAYAKVQLQDAKAVADFVEKQGKYLEYADRQVAVRTNADLQKQALTNRRLVIQGISKHTSPALLLQQLSKFGRVVQFDMPVEVRKQLTPQEVKGLYDSKSGKLLKIKTHKRDGSTSTEYYPAQDAPEWKYAQTSKELLMETQKQAKFKAQQYLKRTKYPIEIDAYETASESHIDLSTKGYAFVTYSCTEEAQNCYFNTQEAFVVERATKNEFHYDKDHKLAILRYADQKVIEKQFEEFPKNSELQEYGMHRQMLLQDLQAKFMEIVEFNDFMEQDPEFLEMPDLKKLDKEEHESLKELFKKHLGASSGMNNTGKVFSEAAELEIFGSTLSGKTNPFVELQKQIEKEKLSVLENFDYEGQVKAIRNRKLFKGFVNLELEEIKDYVEQEYKYRNIPEAATEEEVATGAEGEEETAETPRAEFSTHKVLPQYRQPTLAEMAERRLDYFRMTKKIINEYFGVFEDEVLHDSVKTYQVPTLNKHRVTLQDGTPFLVEEGLREVLKFHYDFADAQQLFTKYHMEEQAWKSLPIGTRQSYRELRQKSMNSTLVLLCDEGIPKEFFEVSEGVDPDTLVHELNMYEAVFGEKYAVVHRQNKPYICKLAVVDSRLPLAQMVKASALKLEENQNFEQATKAASEFLTTGQLSTKAQELGLTTELNEDELDQLVELTGIPKKNLKSMLAVCSDFHKDSSSVKQEWARQLQLEKIRLLNKEVTQDDIVRDVDNVDVKKSDGKFRTSRFRQL